MSRSSWPCTVTIARRPCGGGLCRQRARPLGHQCPAHLHQGLCLLRAEIVVAPDIPNNAGSLGSSPSPRPYKSSTPSGPRRWRFATCSATWCPTWSSAPSPRPFPARSWRKAPAPFGTFTSRCAGRRDSGGAEILMFNSGGMGARPELDGLSATAFPSGVMTMPIEATEHAGPIVIWRKELRPDSGGDGEFRGGLGQIDRDRRRPRARVRLLRHVRPRPPPRQGPRWRRRRRAGRRSALTTARR